MAPCLQPYLNFSKSPDLCLSLCNARGDIQLIRIPLSGLMWEVVSWTWPLMSWTTSLLLWQKLLLGIVLSSHGQVRKVRVTASLAGEDLLEEFVRL